jgi:hypothetical protein
MSESNETQLSPPPPQSEPAAMQLPTPPDNVEIVGPTAAEASFPTLEEEREITNEAAAEQKLAGKYDNVDQLVNAYEEAQRKITELSQQQPASPAWENEMQGDRDIQAVLEATGLDMSEIRKSWEESFSLTPEQYDAFRAQGYSKDVVDTFITGQYAVAQEQQSIQDRMKSQATEMAGGQEQLTTVMEWAASHYNEGETNSLNQRLADPRTYESAIKEVLYDHRSSTGSEAAQPLAGTQTQAPPPGVEGYNTVQEVLGAFTQMRETGVTAEHKARLAKTPQHLLEGVE